MRLAPTRSASSTVSCVTSRQRRTPRTSSSIEPTISPALSYSSCSRKGAAISMRSYNSRMRIAYLQCQHIAFHKSIRHERPNRLPTDQGGRLGANCWFWEACPQLSHRAPFHSVVPSHIPERLLPRELQDRRCCRLNPGHRETAGRY